MDNISDRELDDMIKIVNDISNKINGIRDKVENKADNKDDKGKEEDFVMMYKQLTPLDKIRFRLNHREIYEKLIKNNLEKDYSRSNNSINSINSNNDKVLIGDAMISICKDSLKRLEDEQKGEIVIELPRNIRNYNRFRREYYDEYKDDYKNEYNDKNNSKNNGENDKGIDEDGKLKVGKVNNMTPRIISRLDTSKNIPVIELERPVSRLEELEKKIREQLSEDIKLQEIKDMEKHTSSESVDDDFELDLESIVNKKGDDNIISNSNEDMDNNKKRLFTERYTYEEYMFYLDLEERKRQKVGVIENKIKMLNKTDIPLRFRILSSKIPIKNKAIIIHKLDELLTARLGGGSELSKYTNWINSLLKIPFGKYINFKISSSDKPEVISNFLKDGKKTLDKAIYGHEETKEYILEIVAQWIRNPESENNMIALNGSAGTGKTCIIKEGLANVLERPFVFISLGGVSNVSYFNGHSFTYEGSTYGKIVEALMHSECMNPIIYFDELDKVGDTPHGEEIINLLIHLTDTSQNAHFNDKYFSAVPIDLSKCLFIFSFNNKEKISPILLDRLSIIDVKDYKVEEKCIIGLDYLLPKIYNEYKVSADNIKITEDNIKYIIENYTEQTGGVRPLKKCLTKIISKINYLLYIENYELFENKEDIVLNDELIDNLIKNNKIDINISHQYMYM